MRGGTPGGQAPRWLRRWRSASSAHATPRVRWACQRACRAARSASEAARCRRGCHRGSRALRSCARGGVASPERGSAAGSRAVSPHGLTQASTGASGRSWPSSRHPRWPAACLGNGARGGGGGRRVTDAPVRCHGLRPALVHHGDERPYPGQANQRRRDGGLDRPMIGGFFRIPTAAATHHENAWA